LIIVALLFLTCLHFSWVKTINLFQQ